MIIQETAYARAGVVGNPSDIFNGKTLSLLFDRFNAFARIYETPRLTIAPNPRDQTNFESIDDLVRYRKLYGYYGGIRLIEALIVRFKRYCDEQGIKLEPKNFTVEYNSTIPFGIGLGGSSAIVKAVLSGLMRFYGLTGRDIPGTIQPNLLLETETEELDISAGPQDRVVMVYGGLVAMDFSKEAYNRNGGRHGDYKNLDPALLPPLFIAYKEELSKSSGTVHNIMRYRVSVEHDQEIIKTMGQKAALVDEACRALQEGRKNDLGPIMDRDFDLRRHVYAIAPANLQLVEIARELGSHANQTGSGGAVIGTYEEGGHFARLEEAYRGRGFACIKVNVMQYSSAAS